VVSGCAPNELPARCGVIEPSTKTKHKAATPPLTTQGDTSIQPGANTPAAATTATNKGRHSDRAFSSSDKPPVPAGESLASSGVVGMAEDVVMKVEIEDLLSLSAVLAQAVEPQRSLTKFGHENFAAWQAPPVP
jgi:hypothetical protein